VPLARLTSFLRKQRGQSLIITVVMLTTGVLMLAPVVSFASNIVRQQKAVTDTAAASYAIESLMERILGDLRHGADAIPTTYITSGSDGVNVRVVQLTTSYTPPTLTINGFTPTVIVDPPDAFVSSGPLFIDPGLADPTLRTLPGGTAYLLRIYNVKRGILQVNWAYDQPGPARIAIYRGVPLDPATNQPVPAGRITQVPVAPPVAEVTSGESDTFVQTSLLSVEDDVYTIVFDNTVDPGNATRVTQPFRATGATGDTWLLVDAHKNYIITIQAGTVTLRALVRQIPGFTEPPSVDLGWAPNRISFIANELPIYSWGPAEEPPTPTPTPTP
jgi:hypothetical protein